MSKEHGILFKGEMVRAILRDVDPKEMTRRLQGLEDINAIADKVTFYDRAEAAEGGLRFVFKNEAGHYLFVKPRFQPGDLLYVKETFLWSYNEKTQKWDAKYRADGGVYYDDGGISKWKPSIFMPKKASRIWLEVTDVKCERVCDISEADAKAEGVRSFIYDGCGVYEDYALGKDTWCMTAKHSFKTLWDSINGEETWNHWCFAYTFKRIERPI